MNQMNPINQNNYINNPILKRTQYGIPINSPQIKLLDSIINFYYKNGYEDFDEKIQIMNLINLLTPNFLMIKVDNEIKDPLYYIREEKKSIKFVNLDFKLFNVKIPKSISQGDLYSIALLYKTFHNSKILLVYQNNILKNDESSIDNIKNGDIITIIEDIPFPDDSFYNNLIEKNKNEEMINVLFKDQNDIDFLLNLKFPKNITIKEMEKAVYLKLGYNSSNLLFFTLSSYSLKGLYIRKVYELSPFLVHFKIVGEVLGTAIQCFGKQIKIEVYEQKNKQNTILYAYIGLLNSIKHLINYIESNLIIKIKKIIINQKEININEIKSLSSLGITNNCFCIIDY